MVFLQSINIHLLTSKSEVLHTVMYLHLYLGRNGKQQYIELDKFSRSEAMKGLRWWARGVYPPKCFIVSK